MLRSKESSLDDCVFDETQQPGRSSRHTVLCSLPPSAANIELGASTPLMEAAQEGHVDIVKFLIQRGANVHATTNTGDTALTFACASGHTLIADILLQCGADLVGTSIVLVTTYTNFVYLGLYGNPTCMCVWAGCLSETCLCIP